MLNIDEINGEISKLESMPSTKLEKVRANHMTMKEKLAIHKQIVKENERKLKEWKEGRKSA